VEVRLRATAIELDEIVVTESLTGSELVSDGDRVRFNENIGRLSTTTQYASL
jgi:hypothetical protein